MEMISAITPVGNRMGKIAVNPVITGGDFSRVVTPHLELGEAIVENASLLPRRKLLKAALLLAGMYGSPLVVKAGMDSVVRAGLTAALSREGPTSLDMQDSQPSVIKEVYEDLFDGEIQKIPYASWVKENGFATNLIRLANLSYVKEKKVDESFDAYFKRWTHQFRDIAKKFNLDITILVSSLKVSGENIGSLHNTKKDVTTSKVQEFFPVLRELKMDQSVLKMVGPQESTVEAKGVFRLPFLPLDVANLAFFSGEVRLPFAGKINVSLPNINLPHPEFPIPPGGIAHYDLLRLQSAAVTTGYMDYEPGERAQAIASLPEALRNEFTTLYPEIGHSYEQIIARVAEREKIRDTLQSFAQEFIQLFPHALEIFLENSEKGRNAREKIGLGENISEWQLLHYTDAWIEQTKTPKTKSTLSSRLLLSMKKQYAENPEQFSHDFLSQQLLNDTFMQFLIAQTVQKKDTIQHKKLTELWITQKLYKQAGKELQHAYFETATKEGALEYDSKFQQVVSVVVTNYISQLSGEFTSADIDSLGWHMFKLICLREIASSYVLVHGSDFAKDPLVDHPYDRKAFSLVLNTYVELLQKHRLIWTHPSQDIRTFIDVTEGLRQRDRASFSDLTNPEWESLTAFFDKYLMTRLYTEDGRLSRVRETEGLHQVITLLKKKELLNVNPEEDILSFYQAFENIMYKRYDIYPWLSSSDVAEINTCVALHLPTHFQAPILVDGKPAVSSPVYFNEYPPLTRAQDVVSSLVISH